ncbi:unnamed protein product, partial [Didymodactylos carnosus]
KKFQNDQEDYLNYTGEKSFYASEQSQQIEDKHEFVKRMLTQFRQHTTTQTRTMLQPATNCNLPQVQIQHSLLPSNITRSPIAPQSSSTVSNEDQQPSTSRHPQDIEQASTNLLNSHQPKPCSSTKIANELILNVEEIISLQEKEQIQQALEASLQEVVVNETRQEIQINPSSSTTTITEPHDSDVN